MSRVKNLYWDTWNLDHIARHKVDRDEVAEAILDKSAIWSETYSERSRVIGKTGSGKVLTIILFQRRDKVFYTVTARPASKQERKLYDKAKKQNTRI